MRGRTHKSRAASAPSASSGSCSGSGWELENSRTEGLGLQVCIYTVATDGPGWAELVCTLSLRLCILLAGRVYGDQGRIPSLSPLEPTGMDFLLIKSPRGGGEVN